MDGWTPLCSFLGLKEPEDGFPEVRYKNRDKSQPEWFGRVTGMTLLFHPNGVMISLLRRELLSNAVTGFSFATLLLFVLFLLEGPHLLDWSTLQYSVPSGQLMWSCTRPCTKSPSSLSSPQHSSACSSLAPCKQAASSTGCSKSRRGLPKLSFRVQSLGLSLRLI